jgi:hypothetical protein
MPCRFTRLAAFVVALVAMPAASADHPSETWSPPGTHVEEYPSVAWKPSVASDTIFAAPIEPGAVQHDPAAAHGTLTSPGAPEDEILAPAACGDLSRASSSEVFAAPELPQPYACPSPYTNSAPYCSEDFAPDPFAEPWPYDPCTERGVYGGKYLNPTQRPLIEWGMPLYDTGPVPAPGDKCGPTNPTLPRFYLYGDYRLGAAYISQNGQDKGVLANRLNLEWDLWLTSTERFHMFTGPFQDGNDFMRFEVEDGDVEFFSETNLFDEQTDTLFFEGDLGYIVGGWTGQYASFDMPFTVGLIPLLFQNGIWMEDAILGAAVTIPARNSPYLDWSNYDVTFFTGFDQVTSPAFGDSNTAANVFGVTTFIESRGGYWEVGYAFLDDKVNSGFSYSNVGVSYTRRYFNLVSNSLRAIGNAGQTGPTDDRTANGVLLIAENSFLTRKPYNVIPYVNTWIGIDNPQSVARAGGSGGILRNTGILFETDALTGFPTLDATGAETYGAAFGIDLLAPEFTHQLILEAAVLQVYGDPAIRNAPGDQYGLGARYQYPISNAHLLRFDVMHGFFDDADDVSGARAEFRWKF